MPLGHVLCHQFDESFVMGRFQQMHQFMDNYVFQTLPWLFGKVGVQKNSLGRWVAATPFGLHAAHRDTVGFHPYPLLPTGN
jgi:hypothetical protein